MTLRFVSAGAAHGLVAALAAREGVAIDGSFGAVGAMLETFRAGAPCDIVILTRAQVGELVTKGEAAGDPLVDIGSVPTSIAVPAARRDPDVASEDALRATLLAAEGIYFPDAVKSTAGSHFAKVLARLGIERDVAGRVRTFANGATAMRALAEAGVLSIGCTQSTEILATPGVRLVASLPPGCELETVYTAAVAARAADPSGARRFVAAMADPSSRTLRAASGFRLP